MEKLWSKASLPFATVTPRRRALGVLGGGGLGALLGRLGDEAAAKKKRNKKRNNKKKQPQPVLTFGLVRSEAAVGDNCLATASGSVKIFELGFAERMEVSITGLPANTEFDVFVIQALDAPFGMSW